MTEPQPEEPLSLSKVDAAGEGTAGPSPQRPDATTPPAYEAPTGTVPPPPAAGAGTGAPPPPPPGVPVGGPPTFGHGQPQTPYGGAPAPGYGPPVPGYGPPASGYGQPQTPYGGAPAPGYGQPQAQAPHPQQPYPYAPQPGYAPPGAQVGHSRIVAGLLGILLGGLGVHRFYLGYVGIGIAQIAVTIVTLGLGSVWGLVEGILYLTDKTGSYSRDAAGIPLHD